VKIAVEEYTGEEWLWDVCGRLRRPIPQGKVRLQWQCVSISALVQASVVTDGSLVDPLSGKMFHLI
jgi:hypothetical protein